MDMRSVKLTFLSFVLLTGFLQFYGLIEMNKLVKPIIWNLIENHQTLSPQFTKTRDKLDAPIRPIAVRVCTQAERLQHIRRACSKITVTPRPERLYVNHASKIAYCVNPKAACSSLTELMVRMTLPDTNRPLKIGNIHDYDFLYGVGITQEPYDAATMKDYLKITTTREPFDRLLSGYFSKMTTIASLKDMKYQNIKHFVLKNFRKNPHNTSPNVSLEEMVDFVLSNSTYHGDAHFSPYVSFCNPCLIDFDVIIRQETFVSDVEHLLTLPPFQKISINQIPKRNSIRADNMSFVKNLSRYFSNIKTDKLKMIKEEYSAENILYGYDFDLKTLHGSCAIETKNDDVCC